MLTVHDDEFWKGVKPVEFGDMPSPGEKVIITGYRNDSYYLSLMTARVSRLGMTRNLFWGNKLLAFQVHLSKSVRNFLLSTIYHLGESRFFFRSSILEISFFYRVDYIREFAIVF